MLGRARFRAYRLGAHFPRLWDPFHKHIGAVSGAASVPTDPSPPIMPPSSAALALYPCTFTILPAAYHPKGPLLCMCSQIHRLGH